MLLAQPLLVVVDYGERWQLNVLTRLVESLPLDYPHRRVRVLLLARPGPGVWDAIAAELDRSGVDLPDPIPLAGLDVPDRAAAFTDAATVLAQRLQVSAPPRHPRGSSPSHLRRAADAARGSAFKNAEILVLRMRSPCCAAKSIDMSYATTGSADSYTSTPRLHDMDGLIGPHTCLVKGAPRLACSAMAPRMSWAPRANSRPPQRLSRTIKDQRWVTTVSRSYPNKASPTRVRRNPQRRSPGQPSAAATPDHAEVTPLPMTHRSSSTPAHRRMTETTRTSVGNAR